MRSESRLLTCLPLTEAVRIGECDKGFEAGQHQKPDATALITGYNPLKRK